MKITSDPATSTIVVTMYDRVYTVRLSRTHQIVVQTTHNIPSPTSNVSTHYGMYYDYALCENVFKNILYVDTVQATKNNLKAPIYHVKWNHKKYIKLFSYHFHPIWKALHDDSLACRIDKRIYSLFGTKSTKGVNYYQRKALLDALATNEYVRNDFFNNRAAALTMIFIDRLLGQRDIYFQANEHDTAYLESIGFSIDYTDERKIGYSLGVRYYEKLFLNWRCMLSPTFKPYRALNKSLENIPYPISEVMLTKLVTTKLKKPLGYLGWYICATAHTQTWSPITDLVASVTREQFNELNRRYQKLIDAGIVECEYGSRTILRKSALIGFLLGNDITEFKGNIFSLFEKRRRQAIELKRKNIFDNVDIKLKQDAIWATFKYKLNEPLIRDPYFTHVESTDDPTLVGYNVYKDDLWIYRVTLDGITIYVILEKRFLKYKLVADSNSTCKMYAVQIVLRYIKKLTYFRYDVLRGAPLQEDSTLW